MKHKYVKCQTCAHQLENYPEKDWAASPCEKCKNTRHVIDPKEILCNLCGECMCPLGTMNEQYPHGLHDAVVDGGYDSYHLFDMTRYTFSFCEKCLRTLFNQCKIKPAVMELGSFGLLGDAITTWNNDQTAYEYRVWRDDGGHHQAYLNRKCNAAKNCPEDAIYTQLIENEFTEDCFCEKHKESVSNYSLIKFTKFIPNVLKPFL